MSPLEIAAAVLSLVSVWLTVREHIWCWPTGIAGVALYGVVFFRTRLYADTGLQVVFAILSFYGWWEWLHGGAERTPLKVATASNRARVAAFIAGAAFAVGLGALLRRFTNAALPWVDSALTSYSLVAQWLLTKKYIENWVVWILVDVVYIGMFAFKQLYVTSALYAIFLLLSLRGFFEWRRSLASA